MQVVDLFDAKGDFLKDWIHQDFIEIGTELYGNWKLDVCNIPRMPSKFTPEERNLFNSPNYKYLALGISTFLRKLAETNPECLTEANLQRLGGPSGDKVPWITAKVLTGVEKAGLLAVLNNAQFTMEELEANANLDCGSSAAQGEFGIYFRHYAERGSGQPKKPCSLYVGQTVNFPQPLHVLDRGRTRGAEGEVGVRGDARIMPTRASALSRTQVYHRATFHFAPSDIQASPP